MTLTFGTGVFDIYIGPRQRIIDCKLKKNRWPRRSENFAQTRPPFVFAAVKPNPRLPRLNPRATFARLIKGGTLFPPSRKKRKKQVTRVFFVLLRSVEKGRAGSMQIYTESPHPLSASRGGADDNSELLRLLGYRIHEHGGGSPPLKKERER